MALSALMNPTGAGFQRTYAGSLLAFQGNESAISGANAAAIVLMDADPSRCNVVGQIHFGYSAAPTGGLLTIEDGLGNVVYTMPVIGAAMQVVTFTPTRSGSRGNPLRVTLAAGSGSVVGYLYVNCWREA
jgi:hypothetical protein